MVHICDKCQRCFDTLRGLRIHQATCKRNEFQLIRRANSVPSGLDNVYLDHEVETNIILDSDILLIEHEKEKCLINSFTNDIYDRNFLKSELQKPKTSIVDDMKDIIKPQTAINEKLMRFENSTKLLQDENESLKTQLKELTGLLDVLVGCFQRQNNRNEQLDKFPLINRQNIGNISNDLLITDSINASLNNTQLNENDISFNSTIDDIYIKRNVKCQLALVRNEQSQKYELNKKPIKAAPLKQRLEHLANYNETSKTLSFLHANRFEVLSIEESTDVLQDDNSSTVKSKKSSKHKYRKKIHIIGDSIIKEVKGWKLTNKDHKVIVRTFPGASTKCMESYVKPTSELKPDTIILHCGTNDLRNTIKPQDVSSKIINLAVSLKTPENSVIISGLTTRKDYLADKVPLVNDHLAGECQKRNIGFIDNTDILADAHLNRSNLHLNVKGTNILVRNFIHAIKY